MNDLNGTRDPSLRCDVPGAADAEFVSQMVAGASIVFAFFSAGFAGFVILVAAPVVALFDAGLYAIVRSRGARARTGILAWALYAAGLHHPAVLACGVVARLAAALEPRYHIVMLVVVATTVGLWFGVMGGVSAMEAGGHAAVHAVSVLVAAAAGLLQWWSLWRRRAEERADTVDPVRLAAKAEAAAAIERVREREEAEAIRRMFRS